MKNHYFSDGTLDLRSLRHDLRGLMTPLETGLSCMKSGEESDGLMLQEEVLKKLKSIVEQLDAAPAHGEQMEKEPG